MYRSFLLVLFLAALIWSGIQPREMSTWVMEVAPAIIWLGFLVLTDKKFRFTPLLYALFLLHSIILMVGGHYTYAEVPIGNWLRDVGVFSRNNYDKLGHFMQGFVPTLALREYMTRRSIVPFKGWREFFSISSVLAGSACYEFIEWWASLLLGSAGDAFLGTQGYVWDTQSDMFLCLVGSLVAVFMLGKYHDRQIASLGKHAQ